METTTLQAEVRDSRGKGPARRLRAQGQVPGVFYGPGLEPTPLTLSPKELEKALRGERGRNVVFKLSVGGKDELAMVKDVSTDPVSQELLHVDLYRVFEDKELPIEAGHFVRVPPGLDAQFRTMAATEETRCHVAFSQWACVFKP